jgi:hypothetical protein
MKMLKNVNAVVVVALISSAPVIADVTDGAIPCGDVKNNQEMYGCIEEQEAIANKKLSCLDALQEFHVPKKPKNSENHFSKPGKLLKGDDVVAMGKEDGKIAIVDKLKNYHLSKDKIKQAIERKLGDSAGSKPHYSVVVQSPKGKIKLKFQKLQASGGEGGGGFDLGSWEAMPMEKESYEFEEDDAFIALGTQDELQDEQVADKESEKLAESVENFDQEVEDKMREIEEDFQKKVTETRSLNDLTTTDKGQIIQGLNAGKAKKLSYWQMVKAKKAQLLRNARRKCRAQANVIKGSVLEGTNPRSGGSRAQGRSIAQSK